MPARHGAGHELAVWKGFFWHLGIATGEGTVVTTTPRHGTHERSERTFAKDGPVQDRGLRGALPPETVVAKARARIGRPYSLLRDNCEHLVCAAHGLKPQSPQVQTWAALGLLVAAGVLLARRPRA